MYWYPLGMIVVFFFSFALFIFRGFPPTQMMLLESTNGFRHLTFCKVLSLDLLDCTLQLHTKIPLVLAWWFSLECACGPSLHSLISVRKLIESTILWGATEMTERKTLKVALHQYPYLKSWYQFDNVK